MTVGVVENGDDAVKPSLKSEEDRPPFDICLMDTQMAVLNGYESTQLLRKKT